MPRRRKAQDAPAPPSNSQATFLEHHDNIVEKLRLKKAADSALANAWKSAERDNIDKKELKRAIADNGLTIDELAIRDRKYALYRQWLGKPVGTQAEMPLGEDASATGDDTAAGDGEAQQKHENNKAFEDGVGAGKAGAALASCPFQPGSEEYQAYSTGWSEGQREAVTALGGATRRAAPLQGPAA